MNLFRAGQLPFGFEVALPVWPALQGLTAVKEEPMFEPEVGSEPLEAATAMADRILEEAHLEAAQVLQMAATEAESAVAEARQQGFAAGMQEGMAAAQAEVERLRAQAEEELEQARSRAELMRRAGDAEAKAVRAEAEAQIQGMLREARDEAAAIAAQARAQQRKMLDDAQDGLVDLAVASAVRLVHGHLAIKPAAIVAMVAAGLRRLQDTDCTVRVSARDLPLLEAQRSTLERELGAGLLQLQPDLGLRTGSYVINSVHGQVDAQIENQALYLRTALGAAMGGGDD